LIFITESERVYCTVGTDSLKLIQGSLPFSNVNYIRNICAVFQRTVGQNLYKLALSKEVDLLNINWIRVTGRETRH